PALRRRCNHDPRPARPQHRNDSGTRRPRPDRQRQVRRQRENRGEGEPTVASTPDVTFKDVSHLGAITLANGAVIDAGGRSLTTQPSGMVLIRGDSLQLGRRENLPGPAAGASILSNTTVFGNPMNPPIGAARAVDIR